MQIDTSAATPAPATAAGTSLSASKITSDFQTFLKMLTVQLRNQDPLDPVDSAEFSMQLATFSGVEQQVMTNDLLAAMQQQLSVSGMAQMAGWVGQEVRTVAPAWFDGRPITVSPNPASAADRAELVVRDASGAEVQRLEIPATADPVDWPGTDASGTPLPEGAYRFEVVSYGGDQEILTEAAEVYAEVREVRSENGMVMLVLEDGTSVSVDAVSGIRAGA